ncbi:MAG TPA: YeeE/YedE [Methylophilaceae bacterium]|nr:YeeE/YedE [Methylophilaceae bacterium]HAJ71451.1 YeeE/YedE [Methylophilaceae bacterium]
MMIDWQHFTPVSALLGGAMIGTATSILILCNGRIAGISGIIGGLIKVTHADRIWRIAFIVGLISAPLIWQMFTVLPEITISASPGLLILSGLIVGFGTRLGSGCTSGHGICGISRLSLRSIVATLTFMLTGFVTVYVMRHLLGLIA